jgi:hypothetical protein
VDDAAEQALRGAPGTARLSVASEPQSANPRLSFLFLTQPPSQHSLVSGQWLAGESGAPITLKPGDTFYEGPNDVHTVGRNASHTAPEKFVVVLLKEKGAPILVPSK